MSIPLPSVGDLIGGVVDVAGATVLPVVGNVAGAAVGGATAVGGAVAVGGLEIAKQAARGSELLGLGEGAQDSIQEVQDFAKGAAVGGAAGFAENLEDTFSPQGDVASGLIYSASRVMGDDDMAEQHLANLRGEGDSWDSSLLWEQLVGGAVDSLESAAQGAVAVHAMGSDTSEQDIQDRLDLITDYSDETVVAVFGAGVTVALLGSALASGVISGATSAAVFAALKGASVTTEFVNQIRELLGLNILADADEEDVFEDDLEPEEPPDEVPGGEEADVDSETTEEPAGEPVPEDPPHDDPAVLGRVPVYASTERFW